MRRPPGWRVMLTDKAYLLKRESEELAAATRTQGKARAAHEEMAKLYHDRAGSSQDEEKAPAWTGAPAGD